jgi:hypothetical protein
MPRHPAWQPGQAQIAAEGRGHRSAKNAAVPLNQLREAHPFGAAAPLPEGTMHPQASEPASRRGSEGAVGGEALPQSKQGQRLNALTCIFAPPAGLELHLTD